jgi:RNA polymerase sigma-70 factor (ECF subfamily)
LFTIARRAVMNRLREQYADAEQADDREPVAPDPGDLAVDRATVMAGLVGLPAREREILILFYLHDLPTDVCAEICGIPVGTVKSRLSRARRMLRDELVQKGYPR